MTETATAATVNSNGFDPFAFGVLDKSYHQRLVQGLDRWARLAGVPKKLICTTIKGVCGEGEIAWLQRLDFYRTDGVLGAVYVGEFDPSVEERFMAITGFLVRNYRDARYTTLQDVVASLRAGDRPGGRTLLIPNFHVSEAVSSKVVADLYGYLLSRQANREMTFLAVESWKALERDYGKRITTFIRRNYTQFEA